MWQTRSSTGAVLIVHLWPLPGSFQLYCYCQGFWEHHCFVTIFGKLAIAEQPSPDWQLGKEIDSRLSPQSRWGAITSTRQQWRVWTVFNTLMFESCRPCHGPVMIIFKLPSIMPRNFHTSTVERNLTGWFTAWFGKTTKQKRCALKRAALSTQHTIYTVLHDLQTIYSKRCWTKARTIERNLSTRMLFSVLWSGKCFSSPKAKTERMWMNFFLKAIQALNKNNT